MAKVIESEWTEKKLGRTIGTTGEKKLAELNERESKALLYRGVTVSDMEVLFRMDRRTILSKIAGAVQPCGFRGKTKIEVYQIRDIAPYLIKPVGDIEDYIKRMRPNDLPPLLSKEYWNGQRARQKFEEEEGDLWRTEKVIETLGEVFKTVRMNLLLIPDTIERTSTLDDNQRDHLRDLIDQTLQRMRDALVTQFGGDDSATPGISDNRTEDDEFYVPPELLEDTRELEQFEFFDDDEL